MTDKEIVTDIKKKVSEYFNITEEQLTGHSRKEEYLFPRFIAIGLLFDFTFLIPKQIMAEIGNKHRSNFYNTLKKLKELRQTAEFKNAWKYLRLLCDPDKPELPDHSKTFFNPKRKHYRWDIEGAEKVEDDYQRSDEYKPKRQINKNLETFNQVRNQL